MAILPADILIADSSADWMRDALPLVIQQDLATSRNLAANFTNSESAAFQIGATEILRSVVENRQGRISIQATITDASTQRNRQVVRVEELSSAGLLSIANELAKRLSSGASDYPTKSDVALKNFTSALETASAPARTQMLNNAVAADPAFGLAYIALAETLAQSGQNVTPLLDEAAKHRSSFTPLDQARFTMLAERLLHAPLPEQEKAAQNVLQIAPNLTDVVSALGAERFLLGDATGGEALLKRASDLNPASAASREQLAVGLFETKRFREAEKIFEGLDNNSAILPALATCVFLEGDVNRADAVFNRYLTARQPNDPLTPLLRASWLAISNRRTKAIETLKTTTFTNTGVQSIALSQIAVWQMMAGDRVNAKTAAASAAGLDPRPSSFAGMTVLMANGDVPADQWRERVNALALREQAKQTILGYGLFLNGHFAEAGPIWQKILQESGGADLRARAMLAGSLDRAGRAADARKVLVEAFVPEFGDLYAAISFGEMQRLLLRK